MSLRKKIILSIGVMVTMLVAVVIGLTSNNSKPKPQPVYNNESTKVVKVEKPLSYTYQPGEIVVKKGEDIIDYNYEPSVSAKDESTATTTAYEYIFPNVSDEEKAVYLKSIDTTGVKVSYYCSDRQIEDTDTITGLTTFSLQTITANTGIKYVYILVTPDNLEIPVSFTTNVKWNYGKSAKITVNNNLNTTSTELTIIDGQSVDEGMLSITAPTGYYFDTWFIDENFTKMATFPLIAQTKTLYARFHNFPQNSDTVDASACVSFNDGEYSIVQSEYTYYDEELGWEPGYLGGNLIVPTIYDDGTNGKAYITSFSVLDTANLTALTGISLPVTTTYIREEAFSEASLVNVDLSNCINLTSIGSSVFSEGCTSLVSIKLPNSLQTIGSDAFNGCTALRTIDLSNTKITTIAENTFYGCSALTSVKLPKTLQSINNNAFYGCSSLNEITIPNSVTSIGASAFYNCSSLTNITLPQGITTVPDNCFYSCILLSNVNMSACVNMISIGDSAFRNCYALNNVILPANITTISADAFNACDSLTDVVLPKQLTTINNQAFKGCSSLTKITIPSGVNKIGKSAFENCTGLDKLTFEDTSTWYKTSTSDYANGTSTNVNNHIINSKTFSQTSDYYNYYWYKENVPTITLDANGGTYKNITNTEDCDYNVTYARSERYSFDLNTEGFEEGDFYESDGEYIRDVYECYGAENNRAKRITFNANAGSVVVFTGFLSVPSGENAYNHVGFSNLDSYDFVYEGNGNYLWPDAVYFQTSTPGYFTVAYQIDVTGPHSISVVHAVGAYDNLYGDGQIKINANMEVYEKDNTSSLIYNQNINVDEIAKPIRKNYAFTGWYTDSVNGTQVTGTTTLSSDTTLYAHWTEANTMTLNTNGGTFEGVDSATDYQYDIINVVTDMTNSTYISSSDGVYSDGWFDFYGVCDGSNSATISFTANAGDFVTLQFEYSLIDEYDGYDSVSYTLSWIREEYNSFYPNTDPITYAIPSDGSHTINITLISTRTEGGSAEARFKVSKSSTAYDYTMPIIPIPVGDAIGTIATPVRDGYNFLGWFTSKSGGTLVTSDAIINSDTTLYAHWGVNTITLDANGGTFEDISNMPNYTLGESVQTKSENYTIETISDPLYDIYGFTLNSSGYYKDDTNGAWLAQAMARITFNANAGDVVSFDVIYSGVVFNPPYMAMFSYLDSALPTDMSDYGDPYVSIQATGDYDNFETISQTITYEITTSGEHFIDIKYITGESGVDNCSLQISSTLTRTGLMESYEIVSACVEDDAIVGNLAVPVREGYTFAGWYNSQIDGDRVSYDTVITSDMTLYAYWTKN